MKHRFTELLGLKTLADGDITTIDLDMSDPISELILDLRVTLGAGGDTTEHNIKCFSKIEIVDGSDVLFSLDGAELQALDIYHSGIHPRGGWLHGLQMESDMQVAISFGRYLWDEVIALNPVNFSNPQLKVTFDAGAGGRNTASGRISVLAALFDEKVISPTGFFMTKEIKRWTTVANAHVYTDLPLDFPYRKLLLQSRLAEYPPHWCFANIKLASDQDKKVIVNGEFRDLMFGLCRENAYIRETYIAPGRAGALGKYSITPTMDVMSIANQWIDSQQGCDISTYGGEGGELQLWSENALNVVCHVEGWAPHGTIALPFGRQDVIEDWENLSGIGNLKLDITDGIADSTTKVFIQQYRSY